MKEVVKTDRAPGAIGPYSQAIKYGGLVFTAGQVGFDPATGQLVEGGVEEQTRRALENLSAVLEAAGTSLKQAVKTTVFLSDMSLFDAMNGVYKEYFGDQPPARTTVAAAGLPRNALVEIECVAAAGGEQ
ncbi:MAG: RidA family protein [Chloroflexota bacterium]|nr:RidA family protein [Chloroflexota bacterium]MDQ5865871.1 RidA family protein [Chloroflexota bacterium]